MTAAPGDLDPARVQAFVQKSATDAAGFGIAVMAALGDQLGLFKALATDGPATSDELAARCGLQERYVREWLATMTAASYLSYDPASERFQLPPEHAPVLAQEGGPVFLGGMYQLLVSILGVYGPVGEAFQHGGGVPQEAYDAGVWDGLERFTCRIHDNALVQQWVPLMPAVEAKLQHGAQVADIGCGRGRALLNLAAAYPQAQFVGYDLYQPTVTAARERAAAAGLADRVRFECQDVTAGLPQTYDVILTVDTVHDAVDPRGMLQSVQGALAPDGRFVCVDINCAEHMEDNTGPLATLRYAISVLYWLTTSLAGGGAGLGIMGLTESRMRAWCAEVGFRDVRRVPVPQPYSVYEVH